MSYSDSKWHTSSSPTSSPGGFASPGAPEEKAQESGVTPNILKHCGVAQKALSRGSVVGMCPDLLV